MTTSLSATSHLKLKTLVLAVLLAAAGAVHAPRAEATGIPTFDASNFAQMFIDEARNEARRMLRECFDVKNIQEAVQRVQAIQSINLRTVLGPGQAGEPVKLSEALPERIDTDGADVTCPDSSGGSLPAIAANSIRDAIGLGTRNLDGSMNLRAQQLMLCRTTVAFRNRKWNAERRVLVEIEQQTESLKETVAAWDEMAGTGGGLMSGSIATGCGLDATDGPTEGFQATVAREMESNADQAQRMLTQVQMEADVYQNVINTLEHRQSEVAQMMLSGRTENSNFISGAAAGAIQATLLKGALDNARTD